MASGREGSKKSGEEKLFLVLFGVLKKRRIEKIRALERVVVEGGEREVGISKGGLIRFFSFLLVAENSQRKVFFLFYFLAFRKIESFWVLSPGNLFFELEEGEEEWTILY